MNGESAFHVPSSFFGLGLGSDFVGFGSDLMTFAATGFFATALAAAFWSTPFAIGPAVDAVFAADFGSTFAALFDSAFAALLGAVFVAIVFVAIVGSVFVAVFAAVVVALLGPDFVTMFASDRKSVV